ncbi:unnamed protein product [Triticum turgidum subsp. durum]|uniref:Zinc finger-XS domain-containing protein n=1 Tax=Triticum turgidum subsp. durum TaxID=4567 RepID=A0A9R1QWN5_TRITD|nr:unnamed protein product [Triticum turgidum subsp. durum]
MPKCTMGGRADARADTMAHEASKHRAKLHMEKPLPAGEGSNRQQGGLDIVDHVQAPVQVSLTLDQAAPPPEQVAALAPRMEQVSPLPRVTPRVPEPIVVGNVNKEDVAPLASLPEQVVAPQPQPGVRLLCLLPPLPPPVVVADGNEEEVLSDDVDSDPETQRIFRRQKVRQLDSGELEKAVRPRFRKGYGCPYCNKVMKGDLSSTINHAVGTSQGSTKNGYAFRVKHAAYADYLMRLL